MYTSMMVLKHRYRYCHSVMYTSFIFLTYGQLKSDKEQKKLKYREAYLKLYYS